MSFTSLLNEIFKSSIHDYKYSDLQSNSNSSNIVINNIEKDNKEKDFKDKDIPTSIIKVLTHLFYIFILDI